MTKQEQLEHFRKNYPSVKVTVYDGYMVYKTTIGHSTAGVAQANKMIAYLELDGLEAKVTGSDSFTVE